MLKRVDLQAVELLLEHFRREHGLWRRLCGLLRLVRLRLWLWRLGLGFRLEWRWRWVLTLLMSTATRLLMACLVGGVRLGRTGELLLLLLLLLELHLLLLVLLLRLKELLEDSQVEIGQRLGLGLLAAGYELLLLGQVVLDRAEQALHVDVGQWIVAPGG